MTNPSIQKIKALLQPKEENELLHSAVGNSNLPKICNPIKNAELSKLPSTRNGEYLMDCVNLEPPPYLRYSETSTSNKTSLLLQTSTKLLRDNLLANNAQSSSEVSTETSKTIVLKTAETADTDFGEPSTSTSIENRSNTDFREINNILRNDLNVSSSESDPFAGDDEDNDPDYEVPDHRQNKITILSPSSDSANSDIPESNAEEMQGENLKKKSRKRQKNCKNWKRNKIKSARNSGQSYENWKGSNVPQRKIKASCQNCRMKCTDKISQEKRLLIFNDYWQLGDINRQRDYISKYEEYNKKSRERKRSHTIKHQEENIDSTKDEQRSLGEAQSRRNFTCKYYLPSKTSKVPVCKTFFLNTLSISAQTVRTVCNKINSTGVVIEDRRGKVCKNSLLDESVKQSIREHINSFETMESHYCRQKTARLFLPPTLNISKMFCLYQEYCERNNIPRKATESMYRTLSNTEFNMSFFHPKKDLCDICHKYENSSAEDKLKIKEEFQLHMQNKDIARELKNADKERAKQDATFCAAVFDLQQVLSVPKSEVGLAYYKLKLSTYNFTIFNLSSKDAYCYMWYECIGKRGSSEIGSCLLHFIENHVQKDIKEFSFYSDNCAGQNRNKFLFSLYNYLSQKHEITIRHTFLEKGHTQSEGDSVHSVIEKAARNTPVFSPDQWYAIVRTAKRKQPYIVVELDQENILDLKDLQEKTAINWEKDEENEKVVWNKIKIIEANSTVTGIIMFKYTYCKEQPFKKIIISKKGRKSVNTNVKDFRLKPLYSGLIPLSKKKYEHLQFLCEKEVILKLYHMFFKNLPFTNTNNKQTLQDSDDE